MARVEDAGLLDLVADGALSDEVRARKLVVQAMRSGHYCGIAAGLLVEVDHKWSVETAEQNAATFGDLTGDDDKAALVGAFAESLTRFFTTGLFRLVPSRTASTSSPDGANRPSAAAPSTDDPAGSGLTPSDGSSTETAIASS